MDERTRLLKGSGAPNNSLDAEAGNSDSSKRREEDGDGDVEEATGSESSCQPSGTLFSAVVIFHGCDMIVPSSDFTAEPW